MRENNKEIDNTELKLVHVNTVPNVTKRRTNRVCDGCKKVPEVVDKVENLHGDLLPHRRVPQLQRKQLVEEIMNELLCERGKTHIYTSLRQKNNDKRKETAM